MSSPRGPSRSSKTGLLVERIAVERLDRRHDRLSGAVGSPLGHCVCPVFSFFTFLEYTLRRSAMAARLRRASPFV